MRVCRLPIVCICPRTEPRTPRGGKRQKCPKKLSFRPNRRSPWTRFAQQWWRRCPGGVVLADAAYGSNTEFRDRFTQLELQYVVGVQSSLRVWEPGKQPVPARPPGKMGRPPRRLQRSANHQPVSVKQLATGLPSSAFREITWREGTERKLQSRFAAVRIRPGASRLLEGATTCRRVVTDRIAARRSGTHPVLDLDAASEYPAQSFGQDGQTRLDHRTGLSGVKTRVRAGALPRPQLARVRKQGLAPPYEPHLLSGERFPCGRRLKFFTTVDQVLGK